MCRVILSEAKIVQSLILHENNKYPSNKYDFVILSKKRMCKIKRNESKSKVRIDRCLFVHVYVQVCERTYVPVSTNSLWLGCVVDIKYGMTY